MVKISLNMIVKNEEKYLPRCLKSVEGLFDEIIIVDTGSTDRTVEIAKSYGAKVVPFTWIDDFSAARNCALDNSKGSWVFWLDADEWLDSSNKAKLKDLIQSLTKKHECHVLKTQFLDEEGLSSTEDESFRTNIRLFKNKSEYRWFGKITEYPTPINQHSDKTPIQEITIFKQRLTTLEEDIAQRRYYLQLIHKELKDRPENIILNYQAGFENHFLENYQEAIPYLEYVLQQIPPKKSYSSREYTILTSTYLLLAQSYYFTGDVEKGLNLVQEGRDEFPKNIKLLHFLAGIKRFSKQTEKAIELFDKIVELAASNPQEILGMQPKQAAAVANYNLAEIYAEQGNQEKAGHHWQNSLKNNPDNLKALSGMAKQYKTWNKRPELISTLQETKKRAHSTNAKQWIDNQLETLNG